MRILSKLSPNFWIWAGKVLPMSALLIIGILWVVRPNEWFEHFLIFVASSFGTIAFIWWWWVIEEVQKLNENIEQSRKEFRNISNLIIETKNILSKRAEELKKDHQFKK